MTRFKLTAAALLAVSMIGFIGCTKKEQAPEAAAPAAAPADAAAPAAAAPAAH